MCNGLDEIILDAAGWKSVEDFYFAYLSAIRAPSWHGHNLDAVWDSLTGGDINGRNPPFRIRVAGTAQLGRDVRQLLDRFTAMIDEARLAGQPVSIELLP